MAEQTYEQRVLAIRFDVEKHRGPAAAYRATRNEAAEIAAEADTDVAKLRDALFAAREEILWWVNEHRCCDGHQSETIDKIDQALKGGE